MNLCVPHLTWAYAVSLEVFLQVHETQSGYLRVQ